MIHRFFQNDSIRIILLFLAFVLTTGPFLLLSSYNHPSADDFCYTNMLAHHNFWEVQLDHYYTWTGRYTATLLLTLDPIDLKDLGFYRSLPGLLMITFGLCVYLLINILFFRAKQTDKLVIAFLIFFLYIYYIPSMSEAFFYRAGSLTYQLASNLTLLFIVVLLQINHSRAKLVRVGYTLLAGLLAVLTIGLNETSMIILFVITTLWAGGKYIFQRYRELDILLIFLIVCGATALVIGAPGNTVRMSEKPEKFQLLFSLVGATKTAAYFILSWIPATAFVTTLCLPVLNRISLHFGKPNHYQNLKGWHLVAFSICFFGFLTLCFFPSFWTQGGRPPFRTINVIYLLFLVGTLLLSVFFLKFMHSQNKNIPRIPNLARVFLFGIVISLILLRPNNIKESYYDLIRGTAYRYDLEMEKRYQLLEECQGKTCTVPLLENRPTTLFSYDLESNVKNENYFYNQCLAFYFGLSKIYAN